MERHLPDLAPKAKVIVEARDAKRTRPTGPVRHVDAVVFAIDAALAPDPDNELLGNFEAVLGREVDAGTLNHEEADQLMTRFIHNNFHGAIQQQLQPGEVGGAIARPTSL